MIQLSTIIMSIFNIKAKHYNHCHYYLDQSCKYANQLSGTSVVLNSPKDYENSYKNTYRVDLRNLKAQDKTLNMIGVNRTAYNIDPIAVYGIEKPIDNEYEYKYDSCDTMSNSVSSSSDEQYESKNSRKNNNLIGVLYYKFGNVKKHKNEQSIMIDHKTGIEKIYEQFYYKNKYSNSRLYGFKVAKDSKIYVLLLSSENQYFPQLNIAVNKGKDSYTDLKSIGSGKGGSRVYKVKEDTNIVIEVGIDRNLDSFPFKNTKDIKGKFKLVISTDKNAFVDVYDPREIKIAKHTGKSIFENKQPLILQADFDKNENLNHGNLDLNLTPLFTKVKKTGDIFYSMSWYYTKGSKKYGIQNERSTIITENCHTDKSLNKYESVGSEKTVGNYSFEYSSDKICKLGNFLSKFSYID